jgi:hypothetical protein
MIYRIKDKHFWNKSRKLKGFVKDETIRKIIDKNIQETSNKTRVSPSFFIWVFLIFCGSILIYHFYTLWNDYHKKESDNSIQYVQPVARSFLFPNNGNSNKKLQEQTNN